MMYPFPTPKSTVAIPDPLDAIAMAEVDALVTDARYEDALDRLSRRIEEKPQDHLAHSCGCYCAFQQGQYGRAEALARQAIALFPGNALYWIALCDVLRGTGHPDAARRCMDEALTVLADSWSRSYVAAHRAFIDEDYAACIAHFEAYGIDRIVESRDIQNCALAYSRLRNFAASDALLARLKENGAYGADSLELALFNLSKQGRLAEALRQYRDFHYLLQTKQYSYRVLENITRRVLWRRVTKLPLLVRALMDLESGRFERNLDRLIAEAERR